jgi:HK97 gp10 family phage protein
MKTKVKVQSKNPNGFKNYSKSIEKEFKKNLRIAGMMVRNTAVQSILSGGKSGKVYEKYNPRRTHRSSGEGQAPASDTGFLASNIVLSKINDQDMSIEVESRAEYSEFLEFGTQNMKARPFMFPALEENKPKIRRMFKQTRGKAK